MSLREIMWQLLLWGALPAWLLAGAADWLCHRRTHIERTSGPRESLLHLVLYVEIALPLALALCFDITAAMLALMAAGVAAHMLTSWWDTAFTQPRRHIAPIEQQIHSWLEMVPLFALVVVSALCNDELTRPRWTFVIRDDDLPATRLGVMLALAAGLVPVIEEWTRGLRVARLEDRDAH